MATQTLSPNATQTFQRPPGGLCRVDVGGGSVVIRPAAGTDVDVTCTIRPEFVDRYAFTAEAGQELAITGRVIQPGVDMGVRVEVVLPADCGLDLRTAGGSIDVGRHQAPVTATLQGGSLHIAGLSAALTASVSGGTVSVDAMGGPSTIRVTGGSVRLAGVSGHADAEVSAGSLDLAFAAAPSARLRAEAGSIRIRVRPDAAFQLTAGAQAGHVTVRSPLLPQPFDGPRFSGPINGGGTGVDAAATAGNITVEAA